MSNTQVALVGQPNCGKSTLFNMLTNIKQHIANYPGVTIDKKSGHYLFNNERIEVIDLPGTYSFSSYSIEEKITRDFILQKETNVVINALDASNLRRNLYLTMQLMDMQKPLVLTFNMVDVAKQNGYSFDFNRLATLTHAKIIQTVATKKQGLTKLKEAIHEVKKTPKEFVSKPLNYKLLQPYIDQLGTLLKNNKLDISTHYLSVKLFENDQEIVRLIQDHFDNYDSILNAKKEYQQAFEKQTQQACEHYIVKIRYEQAEVFLNACTITKKTKTHTLSDKIDAIVLNRFLALPILALIIFSLYQLSIVYGYELTHFTWPLLASLKSFVIDFFPATQIDSIPYMTQFAIWMMNSINALLNYLPIFAILFLCIALLEDTGYMPRIAFILDRVFVKFGLHGESTLPLILSGIFAGGCAVPGVMATKGMNDKKAQMATMLIVPLMNCLAKIPFFTLIITIFFPNDMAIMMFLISTITIFMALIIAKLLSITVLKSHINTPFIMELPSYHMPTIRGLCIKVMDRIWLYLKKIVTIVAAVAVILFVLIQYPGLTKEQESHFAQKSQIMQNTFYTQIKDNAYFEFVNNKEALLALIHYYESYKLSRQNVHSQNEAKEIDAIYKTQNSNFFTLVKPKRDKEARQLNKAFRHLLKQRKQLFKEQKDAKIERSILGQMGQFFVPVTQYAGFDWKINVAFLSSFAARESSVATLGALYEESSQEQLTNNEAYTQNYTSLSAVAIILFMALTPPCIATMIMIKVQTNSYKWMLFALTYPMLLGLICAIAIFQIGSLLELSGLHAMAGFYLLTIITTLLVSLLPQQKRI